jgi:hypothetical protein
MAPIAHKTDNTDQYPTGVTPAHTVHCTHVAVYHKHLLPSTQLGASQGNRETTTYTVVNQRWDVQLDTLRLNT